MPATVSHVLSATTPDDPAYEIRPSHWNSAHAFTFDAVGSEISGAFSNANGLSFGLSDGKVTGSYTVPETSAFLTTAQPPGAYLTTAMLSNASSVFAGIGETVTTVAGTNLGLTVNTDGVQIAHPPWLTTAQSVGAYLTTAMASNRGSDFVQATAAFAGTNASGTIASNGISVSVGNYITTAALSNHSHGNPTLALTNLTGTTASNSAGFTLSLSAAAPGAGGGIAAAAGTQTATSGTVAFVNSNGITFGMSDSTQITASHNGLTTARASNDGVGLNTALTAGPLAWTVNSGGISLNAGSAAGTTTGFTGANISASITHNTAGIEISASVAAPGGGAGITVSMYPNVFPGLAVTSAYSGATNTTAGGSRTTVSIYVNPMVVEQAVTFNRVFGVASLATSAGTGSGTYGHAYGIYSLNGGTALSLMSSWGFGFNLSQSSVTARSHYWYWGTNSTSNSSSNAGNISASVARLNHILHDTVAASLAPGQYWLAFAQSARSSSVNVILASRFAQSMSQTTMGSMFGTNVSSHHLRFHGIVSTNTTNTRSNNVADLLPSSIHTSAVTGTGGSSQNPVNFLGFQSA